MTIPAGPPAEPLDLAAASFVALAAEFFDPQNKPIPFVLRDKRQTQDDPFDEHVGAVLKARLGADLRVFMSGGPLVSPDMVIARPEETRLLVAGGTDLDSSRILAIEVKKLNLTSGGKPARKSGLDYNSTPPSSTVKVFADGGAPLRIPAAYLYVVLAESAGGLITHSLALVSGAAVNEDTDLYDQITGIRQKVIGIGSYGDGLDRQRPMLVFANPVGWEWLQGFATLIHPRPDLDEEQEVDMLRKMTRRTKTGENRDFYCYRAKSGTNDRLPDALEPFPTPPKRKTETSQRGRFKISLADEI